MSAVYKPGGEASFLSSAQVSAWASVHVPASVDDDDSWAATRGERQAIAKSVAKTFTKETEVRRLARCLVVVVANSSACSDDMILGGIMFCSVFV